MLGHAKVTRGKIHDYLGMTLDYSDTGKLKVDMRDYLRAKRAVTLGVTSAS